MRICDMSSDVCSSDLVLKARYLGVQPGIPVTYVPARNTIFLSVALGWAETAGARDLYIGINALDYSGYPDCRPEFAAAFENMANLATKAGVEGDRFKVQAPLLDRKSTRLNSSH